MDKFLLKAGLIISAIFTIVSLKIVTTEESIGGGPYIFLVGFTALAIYLFTRLISLKKKEAYKQAQINKERQEQIQSALDRIKNEPLLIFSPSKALLKKDEAAHFCQHGQLMELKTVGYEGKTASASLRVSKNITIRSGGVKGKAIKNYVCVSEGELVVTPARIIFAGNNKSLDIKIDKLTSLEQYEGAITLHIGEKSHIIVFKDPVQSVIAKAVIQRVLESQ